MEGGVWEEISPCCPCVQGDRGGLLRLVYRSSCRRWVMRTLGAVSSYTWVVVGVVAGDGEFRGVIFAVCGVGDDVVGCSFVVGGFLRRVQFEWGVERFWREGFVLRFCLMRYFGLDQVLWAPGLRNAHLGGCRCRGLEKGAGVGDQGRWAWFGGEGVVVFICPPYGVASLGLAMWGLGLGFLDGQGGIDVLRCLWIYSRGVCP